MYIRFKRFEIDIIEDSVLVFPSLHYPNWGVEINKHIKTTVLGLFAVGEVTGGVHGKTN